MFSRDFARPKRAKFKIYLIFEGAGLPLCLSLWGGGGVHWWQVVGAALAILLTSAKMDKIPSFWSFSRFTSGALSLNIALFRILRAFLRGFSCSVWVCLAWVLCVDCRAFVCVSG